MILFGGLPPAIAVVILDYQLFSSPAYPHIICSLPHCQQRVPSPAPAIYIKAEWPLIALENASGLSLLFQLTLKSTCGEQGLQNLESALGPYVII